MTFFFLNGEHTFFMVNILENSIKSSLFLISAASIGGLGFVNLPS